MSTDWIVSGCGIVLGEGDEVDTIWSGDRNDPKRIRVSRRSAYTMGKEMDQGRRDALKSRPEKLT